MCAIIYYLLTVSDGADGIQTKEIVFDGVVFIAPLYWGVNDVL